MDDKLMGKLLDAAKVTIVGHVPNRSKPYSINGGRSVDMSGLCNLLAKSLGQALYDYPSAVKAVMFDKDLNPALEEYLEIKFPAVEEVAQVEVDTAPEIPEMFRGLSLYMDPVCGTPFLVGGDGASRLNPDMYAALHGIKESQMVRNSTIMTRVYNPFDSRINCTVEMSDGAVIPAINIYQGPKWEKQYTDNNVDISLFTRLIEHLVVNEEELAYVYAWLKVAIEKRSYTYLILSGAGGVGKNILKEVLRALFGSSNLSDGKMSTIKERFNSQLDMTRIMFGDEWRFGFSEEATLKEIQNDTISIERKGVDQTRSTRIYCSMIIANNYPEHNYIAFDGRKFVPVELTKDMLPTTMASDEIALLKDKVTEDSNRWDPNFVASIYRHILEVGDESKFPNLEYKGPGFYKMANLTMFKWQKLLIEALTFLFEGEAGTAPPERLFKKKNYTAALVLSKGGYVNWNDLHILLDTSSRNSGSNEYPGNLKVNSFLKSYRDIYGRKIFEVTDIVPGTMEDFKITYMENFKLDDMKVKEEDPWTQL